MSRNLIISEISELMNPKDLGEYNAGLASTLHAMGTHELTYIVHLKNGAVMINLDYDESGFHYDFVNAFEDEMTTADLNEVGNVRRYFERLIDRDKMSELFSQL